MKKHSSKNIRLKNYDYHTGWFFVTNTSNFRENYFIDLIRNIIKTELLSLAQQTEGVGIDYFHVMPNHVHAILIFDNAVVTLSEFWRRYKAITTLKAKRAGFQDQTLWQRNYFEHVIRDDKVLEKIRNYIQNNPLKEELPLKEIYQEVHIHAR